MLAFLGSLVFGQGLCRADRDGSGSERSLGEVFGAWDPLGCFADEKHAFRICLTPEAASLRGLTKPRELEYQIQGLTSDSQLS